MATNPYFSQSVKSEQNVYEDIIIESLKMYGQDVYYLPRDIINEDKVLNEVTSRFNSSYKVEMYIENIEGFDGEGDLFTKFGVEIRDQATFIVARRRWDQTTKRYDNEITAVRPLEGDLLYIPFSQKLFEITHVEHEQPFYQLSNLPTYKLRCELFEFSSEEFDTNVTEIDEIEGNTKYEEFFIGMVDSSDNDFVVGNNITQTLSDGTVITAEIVSADDTINAVGVAHLRASDNKFHRMVTGLKVKSTSSTGTTLTRTVDGFVDTYETASNRYYKELTDFLDFTESNPFGDV